MISHKQIPTRPTAIKTISGKNLKTARQVLVDAPPPNNSCGFLKDTLANRHLELTSSGPDRHTSQMLDLLADEIDGTVTTRRQIVDPQNSVVGTKLILKWKGVALTFTVPKEGFERDGRRHVSPSAVPRSITSTH
jgi:hypothetical protein